ncbi:MAG: DUF3179 domain-containing protein [Bacteroidetes bacterium]|nr:DUF3179 domain-containing protein [Bacteroidota bacterium]
MNFSNSKVKVGLIGFIIFYSCSSESPVPGGQSQTTNKNIWDVPKSEVFDGGPGKDGIPALLDPEMIDAVDASYLSDDDLILGYKNGDDIRAYSHQILDWHEIINDKVNGFPVAITYCPLTGTGIGWDRRIKVGLTTFGVSGKLYNSNLILYDRETDSNWSQMKLNCVNGELRGEQIRTFPLIETTWKTWQTMYPDTKVVSRNTGVSRSYGQYPYGNYKTNSGTIFPFSPQDTRLHDKERVHGVIFGGKAKAYRLVTFEKPQLIEDTVQFTPIIVLGDMNSNIIVSFERELEDGTSLTFELTPEAKTALTTPTILIDTEGTTWDIFGEAVSGPRKGQHLIPTKSFMGYWFSWGAFYPGVDIYDL